MENIIYRITKAASCFAMDKGRLPSIVYLGEAEIRELYELMHKFISVQVEKTTEDRTVCGIPFIEVKKESYLAVH